MSEKLNTRFTPELASQLIRQIQTRQDDWYHVIGGVAGYEYNDDIPEVIDSAASEMKSRNENVFYKKVTPGNVSEIITRHDWVANTQYEKWDDRVNLRGDDKVFYVLTYDNDRYLVYKCLDNNNNSLSRIKPTFTGISPVKFRTDTYYNSVGIEVQEGTPGALRGDGYLWKFMYEIPPLLMNKFANDKFIPVQNALGDNHQNRGVISHVRVIEGGYGYQTEAPILFQIDETGCLTGSGAQVEITRTTAAGGLIEDGLRIVSPGSGYYRGGRILISSVSGSGGLLTPIFDPDSGELINITVENPGRGYLQSDEVHVAVGSSPVIGGTHAGVKFILTAARSDGCLPDGTDYVKGEIIRATLLDGGAGYIKDPTITVVDNAGQRDATGKYFEYDFPGNEDTRHERAIVKAITSEGTVERITIEDPGRRYGSIENTTLTVDGDGSGAVLIPIVLGGQIVDVVVENGGSGYSHAGVFASSSSGSAGGAKFEVVIQQNDFTTDQAVIEQAAIPGALYSANILNPGNNYSINNEIEVEVIGDGTGAEAEIILVEDEVDQVIFTRPGRDYTWAKVIVKDPRRDALYPDSIDAEIECIIPPLGGHGRNASKELGSKGIVLYTQFRIDDDLNIINQDYRSYSLIRNPRKITNNDRFTADRELICYSITLEDTPSDWEADSVLQLKNTSDGTIFYRILWINPEVDNNILIMPMGRDKYPSGILVNRDTYSESVIESIHSTPIIDRNSGDLVYYSYNKPFYFSENQNILIKSFITFKEHQDQ